MKINEDKYNKIVDVILSYGYLPEDLKCLKWNSSWTKHKNGTDIKIWLTHDYKHRDHFNFEYWEIIDPSFMIINKTPNKSMTEIIKLLSSLKERSLI